MATYPRLRIVSDDGLVHTTYIRVVSPDGTETPLEDVVTRVELTADTESGVWQAVLTLDEVEVDIAVDKAESRPASENRETEEN